MIRSVKNKLEYQTNIKDSILNRIFKDYERELKNLLKQLIERKETPKRFSKVNDFHFKYLENYNWKEQCLKKANEMLRSQIEFEKQDTFKKYKKLYKICKKKNAHQKFLNKKFNELNLNEWYKSSRFNEIKIKNITIDLTQLTTDFKETSKRFNGFVKINSPYFIKDKRRAIKLNLPVCFNKMNLKYKDWKLKKSFQLKEVNGKRYIIFFYENKLPEIKKDGEKLGIDLGYKKLISDSNGNYYGIELKNIYENLSKKLRGSKNYRQYKHFKETEINRHINDFIKKNQNIKEIFYENLKQLKFHKKSKFMNKLQYWSYLQTLEVLARKCEENGILFTPVNPNFTSQCCSKCGFVNEKNRNKETFHCLNCGYETDADFNASVNILHRGANIIPLPKEIDDIKKYEVS